MNSLKLSKNNIYRIYKKTAVLYNFTKNNVVKQMTCSYTQQRHTDPSFEYSLRVKQITSFAFSQRHLFFSVTHSICSNKSPSHYTTTSAYKKVKSRVNSLSFYLSDCFLYFFSTPKSMLPNRPLFSDIF